jgi:hypothetical protein
MLTLSRTNQLLGAIVVLSALSEPSQAAAFTGGSACVSACSATCSTDNCAIGCKGEFFYCSDDAAGCPSSTPVLVVCQPES